MRRVLLLTIALVSVLLAGCSSSSAGDDTAVKDGSGQTMNPSGKPQTDADAARAAQMQNQGRQMGAAASADAKAMQEAMRRTGGK